MKISVLTPTYNRSNLLERLYESLIKNSKYDIYKLMIVCFSVKFVLDFFRLDHETIFISFNQITCLIFIIIICLFLYLNKRKSLHKH